MLPASGGNLSGGCNSAGSSSYDLTSSGILLELNFFKVHFIGWSPTGYCTPLIGFQCIPLHLVFGLRSMVISYNSVNEEDLSSWGAWEWYIRVRYSTMPLPPYCDIMTNHEKSWKISKFWLLFGKLGEGFNFLGKIVNYTLYSLYL